MIRRDNEGDNACRSNREAYIPESKDSKFMRSLFEGLPRRLRVVIANYSPNLRVDIASYITRLSIMIDSIRDYLYALV